MIKLSINCILVLSIIEGDSEMANNVDYEKLKEDLMEDLVEHFPRTNEYRIPSYDIDLQEDNPPSGPTFKYSEDMKLISLICDAIIAYDKRKNNTLGDIEES